MTVKTYSGVSTSGSIKEAFDNAISRAVGDTLDPIPYPYNWITYSIVGSTESGESQLAYVKVTIGLPPEEDENDENETPKVAAGRPGRKSGRAKR